MKKLLRSFARMCYTKDCQIIIIKKKRIVVNNIKETDHRRMAWNRILLHVLGVGEE